MGGRWREKKDILQTRDAVMSKIKNECGALRYCYHATFRSLIKTALLIIW